MLLIIFGLKPIGAAEINSQADMLEADNLIFDQNTQIMTAVGNVKYLDADYAIFSQFLTYDSQKEILTARQITSVTIKNFQEEGQTATLYAQDIVKYNDRFLAQGAVKLIFADNIFQGETLEYLTEENNLKLTTKVQITSAEKKISGDFFVYDIAKKEGRVDNFAYHFTHQDTIYFSRGKSLTYNETETVIKEAQITTCEGESPHYHFSVDKSIYYPQKKLVFYNSSYWHGTKKLFQASQTVVGLYKDEPLLPLTGYSEDEGWYIRFKEYHELPGEDYRFIYKDILSFRGLGLGFREYHFGKNASIDEFSLYTSYNPFTANKGLKGDWSSAQAGQRQMISFESKNALLPYTGRELQSNGSFIFSTNSVQTTANLNYSANTHNPQNSYYWNGNIAQRIKNSKDLITYWNYNYSANRYSSSPIYNNYNYSLRFEYTKPAYIANLSLEKNKYGYDYLPKFTFQTKRSSSWQFGFNTAQIKQNYTDFKIWQTDFLTEYKGKVKKLGNDIFFLTNGTAAYTIYGDKKHLTDYQSNTTFLKNISAQYYLSANILFGEQRGFNGLAQTFSKQKLGKASLAANYIINDDYRLNAGLVYNFEQKYAEVFLVNFEGRTYPFWNWNLALEYDARLNSLKTAGLGLTFNQDSGFTGNLKINYDPLDRSIQEASVRLEKNMGQNWSCSVKSDYLRDAMLDIAEISVIRKMHCQDYVLSIYPQEKIFLLEVHLKNALTKDKHE
ncbi:MAG: hypothetical protein LBR56_01720 [Sporomusaceae bacterium]|nr:hypothetical protein [Sporomusaceae bacterium]